MTFANSILSRAAAATLVFTSFTGLSQAADSIVIKPLHGLSFKAGNVHGVGYFQSEHRDCKLVLTYVADENGGTESGYTITRHEALISSGQTTRYAISEQPYEFTCHANAETMTFKSLNRFAALE